MAEMTPKDRILFKTLEDAPYAGWSMDSVRAAAAACGQPPQMAEALFAGGIADATRHLHRFFDQALIEQLRGLDTGSLKVRERIRHAVRMRLDIMAPYRQGLKAVMASQMRPLRAIGAAKLLWESADAIWIWAGDTATDYNRYTKRALLSGVMASTLVFWLQDSSPRFSATDEFLARRIENVLAIGTLLGNRKRKAA